MEPRQPKYALTACLLCSFLGIAAVAADSNVAAGSPSNANPAAKTDAPRITFSETVYDFGKVDSGTLVKHTYVFTNTGSATLEISGVKPGCGCTAAGEWDKRVEPGKTGGIPIQFNSGGYGGPVQKTVTVYCNDPVRPEVILQLKGNPWKPIEVTPVMATFNPGPDSLSNQTQAVKIISNLEEPVSLSDLQCTNQGLKAELKTVREGKEFELLVTALAPFQTQHIWCPIIFKTSTPRMPVITVNCYLNVQPAIAVVPSQFTVPGGPLTNEMKLSVMLRNNTTNAISFSDPAINIQGAEVKLAEVQTGRVFNITATFPQGFRSQLGQLMEASVKSSDPKYPVLKIPIIQMPSPTGDPPPAKAPAPAPAPAQSSTTRATATGNLVSH